MTKEKNNFKGDCRHFLSGVYGLLVISLAFVLNVLLFSNNSYAIANESTLTLTVTNTFPSLTLLPGTFDITSNETISVSTDNYSGYTLKIVSNGTPVIADMDMNEFTSINSAVSESTFRTGLAYYDKFGYRPSQIYSAGVATPNTDFLPVPSNTTGDTIDVTGAANAQNNNYTLSFGVKVSSAMPAGTYNYTYDIVLIGNPVIYNITYDANTLSTVTDMPSPNPQVVSIDGGTPVAQSYATLSSATPTLTNKVFGGWCDVATTVDSTTGNDVCSGTTYAAGDQYGIDQTSDGSNIRLFAIWLVDPFPTVWSQTGACEFHGNTPSNITGSQCEDYWDSMFIDTGIALYSQQNASKDFEIHFTIDSYNPSTQVGNDSQQTFVNDKVSSTATSTTIASGEAPGLVVRRNGNNIEFNSKINNDQVRPTVSASSIINGGGDVSIYRLNHKIYYSVNNGPLVMVQDITGFDQYFGLTTWFGGYPSDDCTGDNTTCTAAKRFIEATLSNMYIKLGQYTDNDIHEIEFNDNKTAPSTVDTYLIKNGSSITTLPAAPTYADHLFQGWFTAQSGGTQVTTATVPTTSTTYYAHWLTTVALANITNDNITLNPNNTETIIVTNSAELEPYTFSSSNTSVATVDANTGVITAMGPGTATVTMTGTISDETKTISVLVNGATFTVTFNVQGGTAVSPLTVGDGTSIDPLPTTTRHGYNFMGWFTGINGTGTQLTTWTVFDANTPTQYYAYWVEATYVCKMATTLHAETCSRTDSDGCRKYNLYQYDEPIEYGIIPNSATRSPGFAYTCDINADNYFDEATERFYYLGTNNNNAVLYYYRNIRNVTENYNPAVVDLPDSTVWTNSNLVVQANNKVSRFMNYDEALSVCGGSASGLINHTCEYLLEESNFANMNTRQDGIWMTKVNDGSNGGRRIHTASLGFGNVNPANGGSNNAPRPVIEVPLNLVEEWAPVIIHEITFDPQNNGESSVSTIEITNGYAIGTDMPSNPSYTDHLFQRWYDTATDATVDATTVPTSDMVVYAEWKGTVALAQAVSNISVIEGGTTNLQITNVADLETFTCSSSDPTVATIDASTCVITGVADGTATISITGASSHLTNSNLVTVSVLDPSSVFRVTFDPQNGDSTSFTDVTVGSSISSGMPQNDPTYADHVFIRWYDSATGNTVTSATIPTANMTVYAEWKLDVTHAVIANNDLTLQVGDQLTISVSNSSQIESYTFSSSNTSIATVNTNTGVITGVGAGITNIIMTGTLSHLTKTIEVDVTAAPVPVWTVTFNANGGTTPTPYASYEIEDGQTIGTLPTTTRANHRFFGWYKDDGTFYEEVYPEEIIDSDVTFYARWIEDTTSYPILFSEINACTFGGHGVNISGTYCTQPKNKAYIDSAVALYTAANYNQDYEIGFTIVEYNFGNVQQMTLLASKYENQAAGWPGLAVRRSSNDHMEFTQTISGTKASNTSNVASSIRRIKIIRESGVIRFSINDGPMTQLQNMNNLTEQDFSSTVWFGASATDSNTPQREFVGILTDMYVKLGAQTDYVIDFDANGGSLASGEESMTIAVGSQVGQLPTPTPPNANFTFDAWYDESVSPAVAITSSTTPNGNKTYVAHYNYQSSNTPVVFDVSNDATRGYQTLIAGWTGSPINITTFNKATPINNSTWGDTTELSELQFWNGIRSNFINNGCSIPASSDAVKPLTALSDWTSGSVDCSKPDVYDTKINSALTVRLNNAQGAVASYAKADNGIIHNMIPGQTYYWEKTGDSSVYGYVTATSNKGTRWVDTGTIRNARDIGGLPVTYTDANNQTVTGTVAYGRIFRGEKLNSALATELTNLGITTEYNVGDEYSGDTHLNDYHLNQVIHYNFDYNSGDENNPNSNYMKAWTAVTNIMTDITNANTTKNVYIHCRVGADRTGTVAYLLEGLLGVPDEDRYEEYALTNLSGLYDRTRYYKQKSSTNNEKFVFMMGFVKTNADIYNWYMQNPNASASLVNSFRAAMTVPSASPSPSPAPSNNVAPVNNTSSISQPVNNTNSVDEEKKAATETIKNTEDDKKEVSTDASAVNLDDLKQQALDDFKAIAEDSLTEPLGVQSESGAEDDLDESTNDSTGIAVAAAVVTMGAGLSYFLAKQHSVAK